MGSLQINTSATLTTDMDVNRRSTGRLGTPQGSERRSSHGIYSLERRNSVKVGSEELNERRIRNRTEKAAIGNSQIILKKLHKEHTMKTKDYKQQMEQWNAQQADMDAQVAQQRRKKKEIEEAEAEWKSTQQTVKLEKVRLTSRKKELVAWEMDLKEEQRVLSEKEHEIAEFQKSHRIMIRKLEQSVGRKPSDWVHEIDEYDENEQDDHSLEHESRHHSNESIDRI